ncbi:MAG: Ig-like domain-containing protein [Anaerolineae bacterium]
MRSRTGVVGLIVGALLALLLCQRDAAVAQAALSTGELTDGWQSSIIVDGRLDVERGEWTLAAERLDVDPRPATSQSFWASFDAANLYLGWRGARWGVNGTGYVYIGTGGGGATTLWRGPEVATPLAGKTLPFPASYLVYLAGPRAGVMRWDGTAWQPAAVGESVSGPSGDTELRLPWADLGTSVGAVDLRVFAFDDDHGPVISVFPTNQSVLGPWTSAYHWTNLSPATIPSAGQPRGTHVSLGLANPRWSARVVGPGGASLWVLTLRNLDRVAVTDATLDIAASDGLTLEAIQGAPAQAAAARWTIPLGDLAPGARSPITVTARVAAVVASVSAVTVTAQVKTNAPSGAVTLAQSQAGLAVDNAPPVVRIDLPPGATMRSGRVTVSGTASDASGIGFIEVRVGDSPWRQPPTDVGGIFTTRRWRIDVDAPASGSFVVQARGHDIFGQTSEPVSATVLVDNIPPIAHLALSRDVVKDTTLTVSGRVVDPFPALGVIERVEVQVDDGPWQLAPPPYLLLPAIPPLPPLGGRLWRATWRVPTEEGVGHRIRARAVDAAGNVGPASAWTPFTVDTVRPTSTIAYPSAGSAAPEACLSLPAGHVLMWGTAKDGWSLSGVGVSVDGGRTWADALVGPDAAAFLARVLCAGSAAQKGDSTLWAASAPAPMGELALRSRAVDAAGNVETLKPPVRVQHVGAPPAAPYRLYLPTVAQRADPRDAAR